MFCQPHKPNTEHSSADHTIKAPRVVVTVVGVSFVSKGTC